MRFSSRVKGGISLLTLFALADSFMLFGLLYPAIQASSTGSAGMALTLSGANRFPGAVYTVMRASQSAFGAINIAGFGTTFYSPTSTRWGDYSWAVLAPDSKSFWFATEYMQVSA